MSSSEGLLARRTDDGLAVPLRPILADNMLFWQLLVVTFLIPAFGLALTVLLKDPIAVKTFLLVLHHRAAERRKLLGSRRTGQDRLQLVAEDLEVVEEVVKKAIKVLSANEIRRNEIAV